MSQMQQPYPPQGYPPVQQPYYPPQQPQGYPAPMQQPYAQPGYPPQGQPPPAAPVVAGTIDQFYSQPTAAGGPGISWKDKQLGTAYAGVISGKCVVQQDVDFDTKQAKFQRDGVTPKWVMLVPLVQVRTNHAGPVEFPDGEAVFYVRGIVKDELARAMAEAGCSGEPIEGATFQVTLTQRKPNRKGNPSNIVGIVYGPPNGVPHQAAPVQQAQAPVQEPVPAQAAIQPQALAPMAPAQQAPVGLPPMAPVQQAAPLAPLGQAPQQVPPPQWAQPAQAQAPVQQALAPQPPAGLGPNQQALLATLGAGQVQG